MVFERFRTGLVFMLRLNTIFDFKYQASTRPRLLAFEIRLENESRVGTPLRQNLCKSVKCKVSAENNMHCHDHKSAKNAAIFTKDLTTIDLLPLPAL